MIEITEKTVGIWYIQLNYKTDFMAAITEIEPDTEYNVTYRFRYYMDDKLFFESNDKKNWYSWSGKKTKNQVIALVKDMINVQVLLGASGKIYEILNDGNYNDFIERFTNAPFAHKRDTTDQELRDLGLDKSKTVH